MDLESRLLAGYAEFRYAQLAQQVVQLLKSLSSGGLSGEDSGLANVWDEFRSQVQYGESIFFDLYQDLVEQSCDKITAELPEAERLLLWLVTDDYYDDQSDEDYPADYRVATAVSGKLCSQVYALADEEPLPEDVQEREDELDREEYEEDLAPYQPNTGLQ